MGHEVRLDVFQGPIDLLLHLVTKQRLDIYDVSISAITDEYLAAVAAMDDMDLESATGFLVIAATLMELKSARLLPSVRAEDAELLLEERDALLARLVECSTYREAGTWLFGRLREGDAFHGRSVGLEARYEGLAPDVLAKVAPEALARAAARALAKPPAPLLRTDHVAPIQASVSDAIVDLSRLLGTGAASFEQLCRGVPERIHVVVRFLAVLELFKAGAVELSQEERFGDIGVRWTGDVALEEVLADMDEYAAHPGGHR